jgi:hypothetical protein
MKVTCQSLCLLIDEADLGWEPDKSAREHLRECNDCRVFFTERSKLRQCLSNLGTVQAPADFDFRLRARLAQTKPARSAFGSFSFGWRTATVAALVLVLGGAMIFRELLREAPHQIAEQPVPAPTEQNQSDKAAVAVTTSSSESGPTLVPESTSQPRRGPVVSHKRINTREFSSSTAPVVRRQDQVADAGSAFPIDAGSEPLNVSLDDGSGVPRTISVPRVSFGSQRLVASEPAFSKTSGRIDW